MTEILLCGIRDFLQPYLPLLNCHNVDFLTQDHWHHFLPESIRTIETTTDLYELFEQRYSTFRSAENPLEEIINQIVEWKKRIEQVTYTFDTFQDQVFRMENNNEQEKKSYKFTNRTFMSPKKEHEVDILAPVINQIANLANVDAIIDYGSGRGYLGVQLAYVYDRNVLGIESCEATIHSGQHRIDLLCKYQKELKDQRYKTTSTMVDSQTNFEQLYFETFDSPSSSFLLCGLHACGPLSCSLICHFIENSHVQAIVNVACCYHLLEEKFEPNPFTHRCSEDDPRSFPLSRRLIDEKTKLGRNARMLAVQSFERNKADQTLNAGLWYRALVQVLLVDIYGLSTGCEDIRLGKLTKKVSTFEEYVWKALEKLKLDKTKITSTMIQDYWTRYEPNRYRLHTFMQFKVLFAGLIEMLILLDRLLYLQQTVPNAASYLVALFDPVKSPRRWCLISLKKSHVIDDER